MNAERLNKASNIGFASAISFGSGVLFSTTLGTLGNPFLSYIGASALLIGFCLSLVAVYLAVNAYFA